MSKTFFTALFVVSVEAVQFYSSNPYNYHNAKTHNHYEGGDIEAFDGHYDEIYGVKGNNIWGGGGFANPTKHEKTSHDWDDANDAIVCFACGGHGC